VGQLPKVRTTKSNYWIIPKENHYIQNDRPEIVGKLIRQSFGEGVDFQEISEEKKPYRKLSSCAGALVRETSTRNTIDALR
jgi:hypothetical protein